MVWGDIGITLALSGKDFVLEGKEDMNATKKVWNIRSYPHLGAHICNFGVDAYLELKIRCH